MSDPPGSHGFPTTRRTLTGWGRTAPSACDVAYVRSGQDVDRLLSAAAQSGRSVVARGLARSYGDAAQCAGGIVIDTTGLDTVLDFDAETGLVRVGAGTSLDALMRGFVPRGWFVPVTPGTRYVTVGGAIAADIHGKNHHRDGSFCSYVTRLSLATPLGRLEVSPERDPELFWATAGGMGMTGIVVEATLRMLPVETAVMMVDTERAENLDDCMDRMARRDAEYRYSVAWIDCLARGAKMGRSVLTRADHARLEDLPTARRSEALGFAPQVRAQVPVTPPSGLLNPVTVAAFNELWFRKAPRRRTGEPQTMSTLLPPARRSRSLEPPLRAAGDGPVPVRRSLRGRRRSARRASAVEPSSDGVVPGRAEAIRGRRPRSPLVPDPGVDARPRPARWPARARARCSTRSTRSSPVRAVASISPRTPACVPTCWRSCTPACPSGAPLGTGSTPVAPSSPTFPDVSGWCSGVPRPADAATGRTRDAP